MVVDPAMTELPVVLGDELVTPDSSRFWPADEWEPGRPQRSYDKQIVRDWLAANWDQVGDPPALPAEIVEKTTARYRELLERLTA